MPQLSRFKVAVLISVLFFTSQNLSFSDFVSLDSDYVAGQALSVDKLNDDRHDLTNGVNNVRGVFQGGIQSSGQVKADTIGEENMADDSNPRIRTAEGASCTDFVSSGLLPATSASLIVSIPAGVAYPDGYRVEKTSATADTVQAQKWTYYYILTSGSFATNVATIGASTPTAPANSAVLFRASSDTTAINQIVDLRKTSCSSGPFSAISDAASEGTLADLFSVGTDNRRFSPAGRTPEGYVRGLWVSLDATTTQFIVTKGSAYINGKYRFTSQDITVPSSADSPTDAISGLDTGSVVSDTTYYVYAIADQSENRNLSVTYSTSNSTPSGVTNSRLIGKIGTDANIRFASSNTVVTAHAISEKEIAGGYITFNGMGTVNIYDSYNVSSLTDNGTGTYTVTWDADFNGRNYLVYGNASPDNAGTNYEAGMQPILPLPGSVGITVHEGGGTSVDVNYVSVVAMGDMRR